MKIKSKKNFLDFTDFLKSNVWKWQTKFGQMFTTTCGQEMSGKQQCVSSNHGIMWPLKNY